MTRALRLLFPIVLLVTLPLGAQDWSVSAGTGPFIYGDFARRTFRLATEDGSAEHTLVLSAATRAGLAVDLERSLGERWAIRAAGTFTRSPLTVKGEDDEDGVELDNADVDIGTTALPVVFRVNPRGALRFHLFAGPALTTYHISRKAPAVAGVPVFRGTRNEWGGVAGAGLDWNVSNRFAIEGQVEGIMSKPPFRREDLAGTGGRLEIPNTKHLHTTLGVRYRF